MDGQVFVVKVEDMYADVLRLQAENAELRKRLEWQPMETCPIDEPVLMILEGEVVVARRNLAWNNVVQMVFDDDVVYDFNEEIIEFHIDRASGWMPLPEVE